MLSNILLSKTRTISIVLQEQIEKDFFDENYAFRNVPCLFKNAFQSWKDDVINGFFPVSLPSFFQCWYEKYAKENCPKSDMKEIKNLDIGFTSKFHKNIWDLSAFKYLVKGEILWVIYPPTVMEYLQMHSILPEASFTNGLAINIEEIYAKHQILPLTSIQKSGELLYIPPMYGYAFKVECNSFLYSKTILTEYNHDNLYAYFRNTKYKLAIKDLIDQGFKNTKHFESYKSLKTKIHDEAENDKM